MVGAVKRWQTSDPLKALETWRKLADENSALEMQLKMLIETAKEQWDTYRFVIGSCSKYTYDKVIFMTLRTPDKLRSIGSVPYADKVTIMFANILVACGAGVPSEVNLALYFLKDRFHTSIAPRS